MSWGKSGVLCQKPSSHNLIHREQQMYREMFWWRWFSGQFISLCLSKAIYNCPLGQCGCICSKYVEMAQIQHFYEAQGQQLMHTEWTRVCLSFPPFISVVLLLMSSGSRWHCIPFNHRLIHTHVFRAHITQQSISSNYWFSINYFSQTLCSSEDTLCN